MTLLLLPKFTFLTFQQTFVLLIDNELLRKIFTRTNSDFLFRSAKVCLFALPPNFISTILLKSLKFIVLDF